MVKKISVLALAGLLALPVAAMAGGSADLEGKIAELTRQLEDLKSQVSEMDEKSEEWDLASRIKITGDVRSRMDYVNAKAPSAYSALDVAAGVANMEDIAVNGFTTPTLAAFGLTSASLIGDSVTAGTLLGNLAPALAGGQVAFVAAATAAGLSNEQANNTYVLFTNPEAGALVAGMGSAGANLAVSDLLGALSSTQSLVGFMKQLSPAARRSIMSNMVGAYTPTAAADHDNDTIWTTRLRLNLRAKATENVEVKARLAMYKAWGMQSNPVDQQYNGGNGGGPFMLSSMSGMDGATTRQPSDNILRVDRAFVNWNNIGGNPIWFSIGRRPTSDGPPAQLRMGLDARMATPVEYMDYPFDGISMGYAYRSLFGLDDFPGRVRFCYGRGFEAGPSDSNTTGLKDVDFAGLSWDIYKKGSRFVNVQSFIAMNMFNVPDGVTFANPVEYSIWTIDNTQYDPMVSTKNMILDRANLGDIYHTAGVYMDKYQDLNYFLVGGWSRTNPKGVDELGTGLLSSWWDDDYMAEKDGYSLYAGIRYDVPDSRVKLGLEYNWGSENWIAFTPGHDDLYASKLATRGSVAEAYMIYDLPAGEAISKYGKAFMRFGYQHYDYKYTGSGFWLGAPVDIDDLANDPLNAQFYTPVDSMDQVYVTFEAMF